jgi:PDZ domain-containing protein
VRRLLSPGSLLALGFVLLVVAVALYVIPSNEYIFLPDPAHPVAPLVTVKGGRPPAKGGIYFVDVIVRKATILEKLFGGLHEGATLYPASEINPPGTNDRQRRQIDLEDMATSQQIAAIVAEHAAGEPVQVTQVGARVDQVGAGFPADGKLEPDDVIVDVDGRRTRTVAAVIARVSRHRVGDTVAFTVDRGGSGVVERIRTVADPVNRKHPIVGVSLVPAVHVVRLPVPVRIDAGAVGGPSAGLAFALDIYQELGHDIVHGRKIAATGEIFPDGAVGPIGGITQKTIGARHAGVDAFLVPVENAADARKVAHGLRIIPVETFPQALHALATLR